MWVGPRMRKANRATSGLVRGYAVSMLVLCAVFALLTVGFVIPCVIDIAMTPSDHFDLPAKQTWLIVGTAFWAFGAAAWLLVGRRDVRMRAVCNEVSDGLMFADESSLWSSPRRGAGLGYLSGLGRRGPGQQTAMAGLNFIAPDDNPDFLLELDRRIKDWRDDA
jgi:hypothetical protein